MAVPVRMASVGVGGWGRVLADGALASQAGQIVACFSPTPERRQQFAADYDCQAYDSYAAVLADPLVEAVLLATPNEDHRTQIEQAAAAGKHILVEKPITLTIPDALAAVRACEKAGVVLAVGHQSRRESAVRRMKALVAAGEIGQVISVEANLSTATGLLQSSGTWRASAAQVPGGPLIQIGIHHIDTLVYLVGGVSRVRGMQRQRMLTTIKDATVTLLEFENGVLGTLVSNYITSYTSTIHLLGTAGALVYDRHAGLELRRDRPDKASREQVALIANDPIQEQMAEFAGCVRSGGRPEVSGAEATAALAVVLAAVQSNEENRPVNPAEFYPQEEPG